MGTLGLCPLGLRGTAPLVRFARGGHISRAEPAMRACRAYRDSGRLPGDPLSADKRGSPGIDVVGVRP